MEEDVRKITVITRHCFLIKPLRNVRRDLICENMVRVGKKLKTTWKMTAVRVSGICCCYVSLTESNSSGSNGVSSLLAWDPQGFRGGGGGAVHLMQKVVFPLNIYLSYSPSSAKICCILF